MKRSTVYIGINEIVLDGVDVADVDGFRTALKATLTGLAASHRGDYPAGTAAKLHGPPVMAPAHHSSSEVGADVARSVWASILPAAPFLDGGAR